MAICFLSADAHPSLGHISRVRQMFVKRQEQLCTFHFFKAPPTTLFLPPSSASSKYPFCAIVVRSFKKQFFQVRLLPLVVHSLHSDLGGSQSPHANRTHG